MNPSDRFRVIFVLGSPGGGKNTQCDLIKAKYNVFHFSCGELLREAVASQNDEADLINYYMKEGLIVPAKITCGLAKKTMEKAGGKNTVFLIDGFPRNQENLEGWLEVFGDECKILAVLFLDCPESVCTARILKRSGHGSRVDDNLDSIKKRFQILERETIPNLELLKKHTTIFTINADQTIEEVFNDIDNELKKILE